MHAMPDYIWWLILYAPFIALAVIQVLAMCWAWKVLQNLGGENGLSLTLKRVYTVLWPFALLLWLVTRALKA